jgi:hypothetical protein
MKNSFTFNDFVFFNFYEPEEREDVGQPGFQEPILVENNYLQATFNKSRKWLITPDSRVVNNIINYSRALSVIKTENAGTLNVLLN